MAAGDVVNGLSAAASTQFDFQPAAGVECIIKSIHTDLASAAGVWALTDGVNDAWTSATSAEINVGLVNTFINNTRYLRVAAMGAGKFGGYSGIQIK